VVHDTASQKGENAVIKIFEVSEGEWIAAETSQEAAVFYRKLVSPSTYTEALEEFGEPQELLPVQLHRLRFTDDETGTVVSFATRLQQLLTNKEAFPQFFATGNM
jgi:hypothetical protein